MRVVVDEGVPRQLVQALRIRGVEASRFYPDWAGCSNGELIKALEQHGFNVLLTNDKNIANQLSLSGRKVAVIALPHNKRRPIVERADDIADTILRSQPGQHVVIGWDGTRTVTQLVDGREQHKFLPSVQAFRLT